MTQQVVAPDKTRTLKRVAALAVITTIAGTTWGLFEYRRSSHATEALTKANTQVARLEQQLATLGKELETVSARLNDLSQKTMPVSVIFRRAPSGNGLVTFFKNNAPAPIEISVLLSNPVTERRREVNLNLAPNGVQSIGEAEGWVFVPGHHVQVTNAQFGTVDYVVAEK